MSIKSMRVLIGCEVSGIVRRAFDALGHDVWSCDLKPAVDRSNRHIVGDIRDILNDGWDLLAVMHPPCTRLTNSGVRWLSEPPTKLSPEHHTKAEIAAYLEMGREERLDFMWESLDKGADLFSACWNAPIERVAIENPVMHKYAKERIVNFEPATQHVQPWWFGDKAFKNTGLYLRNLKPLVATKKLTPPEKGTDEWKEWSRVHRMPPGPDRAAKRSEFFPGLAAAMAWQWGGKSMGETYI